MKKHCCASLVVAGIMASCSSGGPLQVASPDGRLVVDFNLEKDGAPAYSAVFAGDTIVRTSYMGFQMERFGALTTGFKMTAHHESEHNETWAPVWGEEDSVVNHYRQLVVEMKKKTDSVDVLLNVEFRVFDDGFAFRYVFPEQATKQFVIDQELSTFAMTGDHTAWWIPGDYDTQEYEYTKSPLSEIAARHAASLVGNVSASLFDQWAVQTSLMMKTQGEKPLYLNIHEAALVDYPAMHLLYNDSTRTFTSALTPDVNGHMAVIDTPFSTPWRVVMVSDKATDILSSQIIYNLNDSCVLDDTSWIHPTKYMGVWWEMITGKSQWSYTDAHDFDLATFDYSKARPHGKHGATTENVKRYIDFAAANGFDQLLIEGWNVGWEDWFGLEKDYVFDFVTPYPDFDIKALNDYAHSKGIKLMMHHETSGSIPNYERHMEAAYDLMNKYGYDAVKSGYVGNILPKGSHHYGQTQVRHYLDAVRRAADHKIMVNAHEAVRPTGLARTYPNLVGNESAMGTEYRNMTPGHVTILPFTRLKGGPMDFTPGIFEMDLGKFSPDKTHKRATVAGQLALYVTMYSPLQMAADLPENYAPRMDAFQFIKDVPVDWSESRYLDAEPGEFIVVARRAKGGDDWYVGGVTNEDARDVTVPMDFLKPGVTYQATFYTDAADAHCDTNPAYEIRRETVTSHSTPTIHMAPGGGFAISIVPVK
ncbi:glycoside hydrolase family 97 protein [uncultured Muribaculum sp.]|uniref:glycoside hydrolase family 97 protein n=1 Tax=uncultured Muribaculum sp. TaxID=1918613 RepID=UPI0025D7F777|nr:glycoside hydrolase family 97 protein [uncultured Muribaculum sp.]